MADHIRYVILDRVMIKVMKENPQTPYLYYSGFIFEPWPWFRRSVIRLNYNHIFLCNYNFILVPSDTFCSWMNITPYDTLLIAFFFSITVFRIKYLKNFITLFHVLMIRKVSIMIFSMIHVVSRMIHLLQVSLKMLCDLAIKSILHYF